MLIGKKPTMSIKHNGKRPKNVRAEVIPTKAVSPRPERFRPLEIVVEAVAFTRPGTIGWGGRRFRAEGGDISFIYFSHISLRTRGYFSKISSPFGQNTIRGSANDDVTAMRLQHMLPS